uniref:ATP synthase subunit a n=1 Tax=Gastrocopta cristata TaxID=1128339 RepID=A0A0A6ZAG8_9EUPU|nr:ATP synthase F0 subunit 6 [Gastrocopta cristata]AGC52858.1 ATP synthase F0 subunit 6 [Gastrocopta cristata]
MMTDLFSSMDANTSFFLWLLPLAAAAFFIFNQSFMSSFFSVLGNSICSLWGTEETFFSKKLLLTAVMSFLMLNNFLGLLPLVFSTTTSLWINSSVALVLWGSILISGWVFSFKKSAAHLAPAGAPGALIPFLVLIETVSILIRPITLTVRLVANISAGHIILGLIANVLASTLSFIPFSLAASVMIFYYLFEMFVSFIQAYIFTLLISLYMAEHP